MLQLFWLESLIYFELPLCSRSTHFCDVLAISKSFSGRVAVFSISLSMYLSHADGVPITDPRTLKPSTIVLFVLRILLWRCRGSLTLL